MRKAFTIVALCLGLSPALWASEGKETENPSPLEVKKIYGSSYRNRLPENKPAKAAPQADGYAGRHFRGAMIWSSDWEDYSITAIPYGIYDFTISDDGVEAQPLFIGMSQDWMGGAFRKNHFYGIRNISMFGSLTGVATIDVDMNTWTRAREVFAENPSFDLLPSVMSYDMVTGNIYGIFYNEDLTGLNWVKYDPATLQRTVLGRFGGKFNVVALGAAPDGNMYVVSTDGDLYTVDRQSGRVSLVGYTGVNVAGFVQSMVWDSASNTFLWSAVTPTGSALYALDPVVPSSRLVMRYDDGAQIAALCFPEQSPKAGCPEAPRDIEWNFSSPAAFDGELVMTIPDEGKLTVWLDGTAVRDNVSVKAGEKVEIPFADLSNETHHVAAVVANDNGFGPVAESFRYAGLDVPCPVTDLVFEENNGVASISWNAPAAGEEDGYLDADAMYYRITRLPDKTVLDRHHTSTSFSETLPLGVKRYAYEVIPFNGDGKQGKAAVSNAMVYGEAYDMPFEDRFDMEGAIDVYELIDGDGDGHCWVINNNGGFPLLQCNTASGIQSDDWILSPNMNFEAGNIYRVTVHARNMFAGQPDMLAVGYCPEENATKEGITVASTLTINTPSMTMLDHCVDFSVPVSGKYKIALGMVSPKGTGNGVFISPLAVDVVGSLDAPAAVAGLTVLPDPTHERKATLRCKAPTVSMAEAPLSGKLEALFYRDGMKEPVGSLKDVAPGADIEWTDAAVPEPGDHTWSVRMANGAGQGMDASASAFVGIFTPPYHDDLDTREAVSRYTYVPVGFDDNPLNSEMQFPSYGDPGLEVYHMNSADSQDMYVVFPIIRFGDESVYKVSFEHKSIMSYGTTELEYVMGDAPTPEALVDKCFGFDAPGYMFGTVEKDLVVTEGGDRYLALHINHKVDGFGYIDYLMRNVRIDYECSALAPDVVTDVVASSDLTSKITLRAPAVDYAGRDLKELTKVEIYRNGSVLPVHVFDAPEPGSALEWVDNDAVLGSNSYFIVASNSYGRGKPVTVVSYIGYDTPAAPGNVSVVPEPGNQQARIFWDAPRRGVNGGVLDESGMTYTLVQFFPEETEDKNKVKVLKAGITATEAVTEREATDGQEVCWYGIAAVTPQGTSDFGLMFTIMGRPYAVPFAESFAGGQASTGLWFSSAVAEKGQQNMPTSDAVLAYNGYSGQSQDGDEGMYMWLNGAFSEIPMSFGVFSPKVDLGDMKDPAVSLWLYKGNQSGEYATVPTMRIAATDNERDFVPLGTVEWTESVPGWKQYVYPLDAFVGSGRAVMVEMAVTLGGMNDIMLMDNFRIDSMSEISGIDAVYDDCGVLGLKGALLTRGCVGREVRVYNMAGLLMDCFVADDAPRTCGSGTYLVCVGGKTFKVAVR